MLTNYYFYYILYFSSIYYCLFPLLYIYLLCSWVVASFFIRFICLLCLYVCLMCLVLSCFLFIFLVHIYIITQNIHRRKMWKIYTKTFYMDLSNVSMLSKNTVQKETGGSYSIIYTSRVKKFSSWSEHWPIVTCM